ncbi:hypothetical protein [Methanosarcina sp. KYL-1]|uniref:hypothetical protein n=1 Tax=Methanosarcina sp. KYL-1 TaxID=2602068 RepID=UPI002100F0C7|nr:hypothetical protein [Methanosarcina sp. KYL-1]
MIDIDNKKPFKICGFVPVPVDQVLKDKVILKIVGTGGFNRFVGLNGLQKFAF